MESTVYDSEASSAELVMTHAMVLTGLSESTQYFYVVESTDMSDNTSTSSEQSFTTMAGGLTMHVANIDVILRQNGSFTRAEAVVTVHDGSGATVDAANVSVHWSGLTNDKDQFLTASD